MAFEDQSVDDIGSNNNFMDAIEEIDRLEVIKKN